MDEFESACCRFSLRNQHVAGFHFENQHVAGSTQKPLPLGDPAQGVLIRAQGEQKHEAKLNGVETRDWSGHICHFLHTTLR